MRIHYSKEADVLYIRLKEKQISDTDQLSDDIIVDHDSDGDIIAIEILRASDKADVNELVIQAFDRVMVERPAGA